MTRRARLSLAGLFSTLFVTLLAVLLAGRDGGRPAAGTAAPPPRASRGPAAAARADATNPIILIGTGGLDLERRERTGTPALWSFLRDGSTAAVSVRSVFPNTCPIDGWLSLSAGDRAAAPGTGKNGARRTTDPCPPIPVVDSGVVPGWDSYVKAAGDLKFGSKPGTLGEQLATNKQCVQAVGPGAGVGAAYTSGAVPRYAAYDAEGADRPALPVPGHAGRRGVAA